MNDRRRRDQPGEARPLFDVVSERCVIGCCLLDSTKFWEAYNRIKPEHFTVTRLGRIWQSMVKCGEMSKPMTINWVSLMIDPADAREETPTQMFLSILSNDAPPLSEFDAYVETVLHLANKRSLIEALDRAKAEILAQDVGVPAEHMKDLGIKKISAAFNGDRDSDMMEYHQWGNRVWLNSAASLNHEELGGFGLSPGLKAVQETIGRLLPGKLYIFAGMSSSGKSALARQVMEAAVKDAALRGLGKGYVASLEMSGDEYASRYISEDLRIPGDKIEAGDLNQSEVEAIGRAVDRMKKIPLIIDGRTRLNVEQIRARALKVKNTHGLSIMAVDHLLLVKGMGKMDSLMDRVGEATIEGKNMAKEFGIPVIMLAQIDEKKLMDSTIKWPNSTQLFGGQSIMQNADIVMFVHRPEVVEAKNEPSQNATSKEEGEKSPWAKWRERMDKIEGKGFIYNNKRRGGAGNVRRQVNFDGPTMVFSDI